MSVYVLCVYVYVYVYVCVRVRVCVSQERVMEFTRLTPEELLLATQEAIGDGQLLRLHEKV
jgi:hypothetical protein